MNVFDFRHRLVDDYADYTRSFIHIREPRLRQASSTSSSTQGVLWPEPLIQLNPSFEPGESIDELVAAASCTTSAAAIFRRNAARLRGRAAAAAPPPGGGDPRRPRRAATTS